MADPRVPPGPCPRRPAAIARHVVDLAPCQDRRRWARPPRVRGAAALGLAFLLAVMPAGDTAQASIGAGAVVGTALAVKSLTDVITSLTAWVVGILAITATLFLTLGGLRYLIAGGDPGEVEKAKTALRSAAIGYALAVLAPIFVSILKQVLGA
jgi:hypothetical protein